MYRKIVIIIALMLFGYGMASAQQQDSTTRDIGFNATNYNMQKRSRPKGEAFVASRFSDNTFLSVGAGVKTLLPRAGYHYSLGKSLTLSYGKWLNAYNALKISTIGSTFTRKEDNGEFLTGEFYVSHMFNFIGYLGGYNHKRPFEMSTVEGVGYNISFLDGKMTHAFGAHIGLNFEFAFSEHFDMYIEPLATFYTDAVDHSGDLNWHKYDLGFGGSVGLRYKFDSHRRERVLVEKDAAAKAGVTRKSGLFVSLMTGGQFQNSSLVHQKVGLLNSIGQHTAISVGKWFTNGFALRGTAFFSNNKWNTHDDLVYPARYLGARAEIMLDFFDFFSKNPKRKFSLPLLFGPEIGYMNKMDFADNNLNRYYIGATAALQTRFMVNNHFELFLEPRFSMVPYSIVSDTYVESTKKSTDYFDGLVSLSFGLGYKF